MGVESLQEFSAGLGRLAFSSLAIPWERPFLGPLYKWSCAVMDTKGEVVLPWAVAVIMEWLVRRLRDGHFQWLPLALVNLHVQEISTDSVQIWGYLSKRGPTVQDLSQGGYCYWGENRWV